MRRTIIKLTAMACAVLLPLLFSGCEKEFKEGSWYPYSIIEEASSFIVDPQPGNPYGCVIDTVVRPPYRGAWGLIIEGTECNLFHQEDRYVQRCLEWGFRLDSPLEETKALKNLPRKNVDFVVYNHGITGMDLVTESDFDGDHPAGSSLADVTMVYYRSFDPVIEGESDTYVPAMIHMDELGSTLPSIYPRMTILISRNPEKAGTYVFQQYLYFADGKVVKRRFKRIWLEEHLALDPLER